MKAPQNLGKTITIKKDINHLTLSIYKPKNSYKIKIAYFDEFILATWTLYGNSFHTVHLH